MSSSPPASRRGFGQALLFWGALSAAGALLLLSALGWRIGEVERDLSLGMAPPWIPFLQRAFERSPAEAAFCQDLWGQDCLEPVRDLETLLTADPLVTGVVGQVYEYRPSVTTTVQGIRIGEGAPWISWDPENERIWGSPPRSGRYEVTLFLRQANGKEVRVRWPIFVADNPHPLGTGEGGRDVVALLVAGAKWILPYGVIVSLIGVGLGVLFGGLAGYYGGWLASGSGLFVKVLESIPSILLLAIVSILSNYEMHWVMVALGVVLIPETFRAIRAQVTSFRERDFVEAARELGETDTRILWVEILWRNLRPLVLIQLTRAFAYSILMEVTLRYLNLGGTVRSWGRLLMSWKRDPFDAPWLGVFSVVMIVGAIGSFLFLEKAIRIRTERTRVL